MNRRNERAAFSHIPIGKIRPGRNVRIDLDNIEELADSLRHHGMLQPITVVPTEDGETVEVLFGHRRFAAAQLARFDVVPCFMRGRGDERARLLTQLAENFDRAEMTPLDEALAFRDLIETGMRQIDIAAMVHRSDFYVSTRMSVLKYPPCVQEAVHRRRIGVSSALTIPLHLCDDPDNIAALEKVLTRCELGNVSPLRDWIEARLRATNTTVERKHRRRRYLEVDLAHWDLAYAAANSAGKTLFEWTADIIEQASTKSGDSGGAI